MAHPVLSDDEARDLFVTLHGTTFDWTADQLPALMARLGWTIDDSATIPGKVLIADVAWSLPQVDVTVMLTGNRVNAFSFTLASPADDATSQLEVADAFARYTNLAQEIFDTPGTRIPGEFPGLQWRQGDTVLTMNNLATTISFFWATADFQDAVDKTGTA